MPQTTINYSSLAYYFGMIWSGTYGKIRGTEGELVNGEESAILKWGYGVVEDPGTPGTPPAPGGAPTPAIPGNPRKLVRPKAKDNFFAGVLTINESHGTPESAMITNKDRGIAPSTPADILTWGDIVVPIEKSITIPIRVTYGESVSMRCIATDDHESGVFANVDDDNHILIPRARWLRILKQPTDTELGAGVLNLGRF